MPLVQNYPFTDYIPLSTTITTIGGVKDTRLEAKAKDTKKKSAAKDRIARGQGQEPRTQMQVFS